MEPLWVLGIKLLQSMYLTLLVFEWFLITLPDSNNVETQILCILQ